MESNNTVLDGFEFEESIEWVTPSPSSTLPAIQNLSCDNTVRILTEKDPSLIANEMIPEWKKQNANMMKDMFNDLLSTKSSINMVDENCKFTPKRGDERGSVFEFWDIKNLEKKASKTVNFSTSKHSLNSSHKSNSFISTNKEHVLEKPNNPVSDTNVFKDRLESQKEFQDQKINNQFTFSCNLLKKHIDVDPSKNLDNRKNKDIVSPTKSPLKLFHDNFDTFTNNKLTAAVYELANQETDEDTNTSPSGPERKRLRTHHERVNSITTQDFLNEAQEIMERIRNKRNTAGKSTLESVCEEDEIYASQNTIPDTQKEKSSALKSKRNSINSYLATTNETPARSMFSDWSSEHTSSKNTLISHADSSIKQHKEKYLDTMENAMFQQAEKEVYGSPKKMWEKSSIAFEQTHTSKTSIPLKNKKSNINKLNHKLMCSENLKVITPQDVSHFLSDKIGSMTLDKTKNTWVQDFRDKTEDVFEGIQDFSVSPESFNEIETKKCNIPRDEKEFKESYAKKLKEEGKNSFQKEIVDKSTSRNHIYPKKISFSKESNCTFSSEITADNNSIDFKVNSNSELIENDFLKSFTKTPESILRTSKHEKSTTDENFVDSYKDSVNSKFSGIHQDLSDATFNCSFSITIQNLVTILTDIEPYEPFWEKIQHLNLSNKNLESLIGLCNFCPKLNDLDVSYNKLTFLTGCPKTIRNMNLQNNSLSSLTGFSHLTNIQYLNLSNNDIQSLNVLIHLRQLNVSNNKISSLDGIQKLDGLLNLSLSQNLLSEIDLSGYNLSRLEQLDLSCNKIKLLKGLHNLNNLMILNLDKNNLSIFYAAEKMLKLRVLKLSTNFLKKFLNPISSLNFSSQLLTLQYLELVNIQMTSLPKSFAKMILNVHTLNISYNHLKDINPLKGMPSLKRLFINGNQISKITDIIKVLSSLKALRSFDIRLNPCVANLYPPFFSLDSNDFSAHFGLQIKLYDNTWVEKDREFFKTLHKKLQLRRRLYQDLILSSCPLLKWLNGKSISETHIKNAIKFVSSVSFDSNPKSKQIKS
ncbi:hypothetical protein PCANB_002635 [Pneumocystis canis]|nr:hypothetical protein PCANB_002635 [Pneumocystis canis]